MVNTWLEDIKERHQAASMSHPNAVYGDEQIEGKQDTVRLVYEDESGNVVEEYCSWDALDTAGHNWMSSAYADQQRLIEEVERLRSNYHMSLEMVDEFMAHHAMELSPRHREMMLDLQRRLLGLS
jgi:hypothetical protein